MKYLIASLALFLAGCSTTVPVAQKFPVAPDALLQRCPDLLTIDNGKNTLSEMLKVVVQNYTLYYQCAEKTQGWNDWYTEQRKIYENIK